ncbi:MAG: calcium/sodium antiporter [Lachnospiraceae bacterium]|nr:calcium/sodium antiporter [Lachnospiraceae bacterium]
MMYLLLIVGFVLLVKGADLFVDGSSSIAGILKVPSVIIGLTIVAMGTSAPEAAVSITAGLSGNSDISLGNVIGSNLFNQLGVIGLCAACFVVTTHKDILKRDLWVNIGITIALLVLILDGKLSRTEGLILLLGMAVYLFFVIKNALKNRTEGEDVKLMSVPKSILFMLIGLAAIIGGGNLVVNNASLIAQALGMSETLVGLTIVAIGTSLPELVTSFVATRKGDTGIALGNAIGSNIFNILFILGIASVLTPINANTQLIIDTAILIVVCIMILVFAKTSNKTSRVEGILCLASYLLYTAYIIFR